jgi:hypothetical protein
METVTVPPRRALKNLVWTAECTCTPTAPKMLVVSDILPSTRKHKAKAEADFLILDPSAHCRSVNNRATLNKAIHAATYHMIRREPDGYGWKGAQRIGSKDYTLYVSRCTPQLHAFVTALHGALTALYMWRTPCMLPSPCPCASFRYWRWIPCDHAHQLTRASLYVHFRWRGHVSPSVSAGAGAGGDSEVEEEEMDEDVEEDVEEEVVG